MKEKMWEWVAYHYEDPGTFKRLWSGGEDWYEARENARKQLDGYDFQWNVLETKQEHIDRLSQEV